MSKLPEPEEVDFVVADGDDEVASAEETARFIREYKRRAEYVSEVAEAKRILEALGINSGDYGMNDPQALLDHWRRCVADLQDESAPRSNGQTGTQGPTLSGSEVPGP